MLSSRAQVYGRCSLDLETGRTLHRDNFLSSIGLAQKVIVSLHSGNEDSSGENLDPIDPLNWKHLVVLFAVMRRLVAYSDNHALQKLVVFTDCWIPDDVPNTHVSDSFEFCLCFRVAQACSQEAAKLLNIFFSTLCDSAHPSLTKVVWAGDGVCRIWKKTEEEGWTMDIGKKEPVGYYSWDQRFMVKYENLYNEEEE